MMYMELIMVILFHKYNDIVLMKQKKKDGENVLNECILG